MLDFPWGIFVFTEIIASSMVIYLVFLAHKKNKIKRIMIKTQDSLDILPYQEVVSDPDLVILDENNLDLFWEYVADNIPIILLTKSFNYKPYVKIAKIYTTPLVVNSTTNTLIDDIEYLEKGHKIRVY